MKLASKMHPDLTEERAREKTKLRTELSEQLKALEAQLEHIKFDELDNEGHSPLYYRKTISGIECFLKELTMISREDSQADNDDNNVETVRQEFIASIERSNAFYHEVLLAKNAPGEVAAKVKGVRLTSEVEHLIRNFLLHGTSPLALNEEEAAILRQHMGIRFEHPLNSFTVCPEDPESKVYFVATPDNHVYIVRVFAEKERAFKMDVMRGRDSLESYRNEVDEQDWAIAEAESRETSGGVRGLLRRLFG